MTFREVFKDAYSWYRNMSEEYHRERIAKAVKKATFNFHAITAGHLTIEQRRQIRSALHRITA